MKTTTPPLTAPRVRPLWERSELFREPAYDPAIPVEDEDNGENDDPPRPTP